MKPNLIFLGLLGFLVMAILAGILIIAMSILKSQEPIVDRFNRDPTEVMATNAFIATAASSTATAKAYTPTPAR
jgi:hypothetical protein